MTLLVTCGRAAMAASGWKCKGNGYVLGMAVISQPVPGGLSSVVAWPQVVSRVRWVATHGVWEEQQDERENRQLWGRLAGGDAGLANGPRGAGRMNPHRSRAW